MAEQQNSPAGEIKFWHSLVIGLVGSWFLTVQRSEHHGDVFAQLTNFQRLVQPGFLGEVLGGSVFILGVGTVVWLFGRAIPSLRKHAALLAIVGTGAMLIFSWVGESSLENQKGISSSSPPLNSSPMTQPQPFAPAVASIQTVPPEEIKKGWDLAAIPNVIDGRWNLVDSNTRFGAKTFVDTKSVAGDTYVRAVWIKTFYQTPQKGGWILQSGPTYVTSMDHVSYRCGERTYAFAFGDTRYYDIAGALVENIHATNSAPSFLAIAPGDVLHERIYSDLCGP